MCSTALAATPVVSTGGDQTLEVGPGCVADATLTASAVDDDTADADITFHWYVLSNAYNTMYDYQMEADGYTTLPNNPNTVQRTAGTLVEIATASASYTGTFPQGITEVIVEAVDPEGNAGSASILVIVQDTVAPTLVWTYGGNPIPDGSTVTFTVSQLPVTLSVDSMDYCCSTLDKTYTSSGGTPVISYTDTSYTIEATTTAGTTINLFAQAHDCSDNYSPSQAVTVVIEADPVVTGKRNEGLGNGVDGNTPGHLHNGGNDDPQFRPGNPGARNKNN